MDVNQSDGGGLELVTNIRICNVTFDRETSYVISVEKLSIFPAMRMKIPRNAYGLPLPSLLSNASINLNPYFHCPEKLSMIDDRGVSFKF